jgi:hypothetical protein
MNVSTVLSRALSAIDKKTVYKSPGKMPSFEASSWPLAAGLKPLAFMPKGTLPSVSLRG